MVGIRVSKWSNKEQEYGMQSSQKTPWPAEVRDGKYQSRERGLCGNNKTTPSTVKGDGGADELFLYRTFKVVCPSPTRSRTRAQQPRQLERARDDDETVTADGMRCLGRRWADARM